jgi:hypothetical protein
MRASPLQPDSCRDHPWRQRLLSAILGWGDLRNDETAREFVLIHPFVALRPLRLSDGGAEQMPDAVRQRQSGGAADDHPRDGQTNIATADPRAHGAGDAETNVTGTRQAGGGTMIATIGSRAPSRNESAEAAAACTGETRSSGSIFSSACAPRTR